MSALHAMPPGPRHSLHAADPALLVAPAGQALQPPLPPGPKKFALHTQTLFTTPWLLGHAAGAVAYGCEGRVRCTTWAYGLHCLMTWRGAYKG
jgi:hypothetical protein